MIDWLSPEVQAACQKAYVRLVSFLLGLFL